MKEMKIKLEENKIIINIYAKTLIIECDEQDRADYIAYTLAEKFIIE